MWILRSRWAVDIHDLLDLGGLISTSTRSGENLGAESAILSAVTIQKLPIHFAIVASAIVEGGTILVGLYDSEVFEWAVIEVNTACPGHWHVVAQDSKPLRLHVAFGVGNPLFRGLHRQKMSAARRSLCSLRLHCA